MTPRTALVLVLAGALGLAPRPAAAQPAPFDFYAYGPYRGDVPTPDSVLGYAIGEFHTTSGRLERYFDALAAAAPDRVRVERYGESYERHPLLLAVITSERNLARLEEIRSGIGRLADPRGTDRAEAQRLAAALPIVVWLNYGTDGEESAATETALQAAYQLVAGESEEMRRFRDEAVIVLNPLANPDSHQRFVAWYNAFGVRAEHPAAMERFPPWGISNDNNHYQIDLNRDAHVLTQQESQALARRVLDWRPQVFADFHSGPEIYYFPPPVLPINPLLGESFQRWAEAFGRGNAAAFDRYGWQYFVRDRYDHFYPGYWETWPSLVGATGMTYEAHGGGPRRVNLRREDGTLLTLHDGISHHFVATLATVRTAVHHREARLRDFHEFFRAAMEGARRGDARAFLLHPEPDPRRAAALAATLLRHGVEVSVATAPFQARGQEHASGETSGRRFPAGTYVIDLAQPAATVARTLLEREVPMQDDYLQRQYERWARNARRGESEPRERYEFYDVTSWSLPLAFGVSATTMTDLPRIQARPLAVPTERLAGTGDWTDEIPFGGPGVDPPVMVAGDAAGQPATPARSAYVFRPETEGALRLAGALVREGFNVSVATEPIVVGADEHPRGTFVVRVERNPAGLHDRIGPLAREAQVRVDAAHSAFPEHGQRGVGSTDVVPLVPPRILMIADEGVSVTSYGAAWFTLERRFGFPFTPVRFQQLAGADLRDFNVVVMPDGSAGEYARALGDGGVAGLRAWVEDGGTLVAWGGGAVFAARNGLISAAELDRDPESDEERDRACLDAIDRVAGPAAGAGPRPPVLSPTARPCALQPLSGTVLRTAVDRTHWLANGLVDETLPVLVRGSIYLGLSEGGANVLTFPANTPLRVSGFVWPGNTEPGLAGRAAYAVVEPLDRGRVVAFAHDPNFRAFWRSTARLFGNAVLLGPSH
jgi:hypothetical protein